MRQNARAVELDLEAKRGDSRIFTNFIAAMAIRFSALGREERGVHEC